jgi:hypothetical protein
LGGLKKKKKKKRKGEWPNGKLGEWGNNLKSEKFKTKYSKLKKIKTEKS